MKKDNKPIKESDSWKASLEEKIGIGVVSLSSSVGGFYYGLSKSLEIDLDTLEASLLVLTPPVLMSGLSAYIFGKQTYKNLNDPQKKISADLEHLDHLNSEQASYFKTVVTQGLEGAAKGGILGIMTMLPPILCGYLLGALAKNK